MSNSPAAAAAHRPCREARVFEALRSITIGSTRVVFDAVVTRWAADVYEVGTWGSNRTVSLLDAVALVDRGSFPQAQELRETRLDRAPKPRSHRGFIPAVEAFVAGCNFVLQVAVTCTSEATWTWARTAADAVEMARAAADNRHYTFALSASGRVTEVYPGCARLVHHNTLPPVLRKIVVAPSAPSSAA